MTFINFPVIPKRKLRIAIVGCGRISKNHILSIQSYKDEFQLVAVCDINKNARQVTSKAYAVKGYADMAVMLENEELDLISLCSPSGCHPEQTILAAKHGLNVISEKPMACRMSFLIVQIIMEQINFRRN